MDWMTLLQSVGVPMFILICFAAGVWRCLVWVGNELVKPLRDKLLNKISNIFDKVETTIDKIDRNVESIVASTKAFNSYMDEEKAVCQIESCGIIDMIAELKKATHRRNAP